MIAGFGKMSRLVRDCPRALRGAVNYWQRPEAKQQAIVSITAKCETARIARQHKMDPGRGHDAYHECNDGDDEGSYRDASL